MAAVHVWDIYGSPLTGKSTPTYYSNQISLVSWRHYLPRGPRESLLGPRMASRRMIFSAGSSATHVFSAVSLRCLGLSMIRKDTLLEITSTPLFPWRVGLTLQWHARLQCSKF